MKLWCIEVRQNRATEIYVLGETYEDAKEDADILADEVMDWSDVETELSVYETAGGPTTSKVWSGGPDGSDISMKEALAAVTSSREEQS